MLTQRSVDCFPGLLQLAVEDISDERDATAATSPGSGAAFQFTHSADAACNGRAEVRHRNVIAGTDLSGRIQVANAAGTGSSFGAQQELAWRNRQWLVGLAGHQQPPVITGIANQDSAQQFLAVQGNQNLLVDSFERIFEDGKAWSAVEKLASDLRRVGKLGREDLCRYWAVLQPCDSAPWEPYLALSDSQ